MAISSKFILDQGPVLATLGNAAVTAFRQRKGGDHGSSEVMELPGPEVSAILPPRSPELIRAYVRHVGGSPSSYKKIVPAHLFPQWGFPLQAQTLQGVPYPLIKVLNGGCRLTINQQLPQGEAMQVRARLESIDDNGRRAVLHQRIVTGTKSAPDALVADLFAIVPLPKRDGAPRDKSAKKKAPVRVPHVVDELARWRIREDAGLDFAKLTGDFNPIHWIKPYARAFGHRSTILHGFSTMARVIEGLNKHLYSGNIDAIRSIDVQFKKPLVLPARVGLYVDGPEVYLGSAPGGPAFLAGRFETR
jgi:acyl dehydratase